MKYQIIDRATGEAIDPSELAQRWEAAGEQGRWNDLFDGEMPELKIAAYDPPGFAPGSRVMLTQEALEEYGTNAFGGQTFTITGRGVSSETGRTIYYLEGFEEWVTSDEIYHP